MGISHHHWYHFHCHQHPAVSGDHHGSGGHGSEADAGAAAEGGRAAWRDLDPGGVRPVRAAEDIKSNVQGIRPQDWHIHPLFSRYFKCTHSVFKCKHSLVHWFHTEVEGHLSTPAYMGMYIHFWESVIVKKLTPFSTLYSVEMDNPIHLKSIWDFHAS